MSKWTNNIKIMKFKNINLKINESQRWMFVLIWHIINVNFTEEICFHKLYQNVTFFVLIFT